MNIHLHLPFLLIKVVLSLEHTYTANFDVSDLDNDKKYLFIPVITLPGANLVSNIIGLICLNLVI